PVNERRPLANASRRARAPVAPKAVHAIKDSTIPRINLRMAGFLGDGCMLLYRNEQPPKPVLTGPGAQPGFSIRAERSEQHERSRSASQARSLREEYLLWKLRPWMAVLDSTARRRPGRTSVRRSRDQGRSQKSWRRWRDHFPLPIVLRRRHHALLLHLLDQARGAVIADSQVPLHARNRRASAGRHDLDGAVVQRVVVARTFLFREAGFIDDLAVGQRLHFFEHPIDVIRRTLRAQPLDHLVDVIVTHERSVHTLRGRGAGWKVQHVAVAQQRFRAGLVENRARIDLR